MKKTNPLSVANIEKMARMIRKEFNVGLNSYFPVYEILELLQEKGLLTLQIMDNNSFVFADATELAKYNPIDNFIYVKESIIEGYENYDYRANFTLAHEFFHFLQIQILEFEFNEVEQCKSFEDAEWQANEFAAQLLIPTESLTCPDEVISRQFHVSLECVATRRLYFKKRRRKRG